MEQSAVSKPNKSRETGIKNLAPFRIQPGEVRNPKGRPPGSRNKLADAYIRDVYEKWEAKGSKALDETIARKPWEFVKIVASLMPQKLEITNKFQSMADHELSELLSRTTLELRPIGGSSGESIDPRAAGIPRREGRGNLTDQRGFVETEAESIPAVSETDSIPRSGSDPS